MQKNTAIIIILSAVVIVLLAFVGVRFFGGEDNWVCQDGQWVKQGNPSDPQPTIGCGDQNPQPAGGLTVSSPQENATISSPAKISGYVNGDGWTGFEGQVGTVRLLDAEGKELGLAILTATTDWMKMPTYFETNLNFTSDKEQAGTLVFRNENASGDPIRDKEFSLPVKISKTQPQTMSVQVFFNNTKFDPNLIDCSKVYPASRTIPKTPAVARAALEELLKGPTEQEKADGYLSNIINSGVKIQSLTIDQQGTAKVDFDETLERGVGGSCRVAAIRSQITNTLKQFPTVKNVIISIDGRTEDILQP